MRYPGTKIDKEQLFLTPKSIMSKYATFFDPSPHPRPDGFDGLRVDWGEHAFVTPPWGNIRPWVEKAILEREKGCCVHMLIAASPLPGSSRISLFFQTRRYNGYEEEFRIIGLGTGRPSVWRAALSSLCPVGIRSNGSLVHAFDFPRIGSSLSPPRLSPEATTPREREDLKRGLKWDLK